MKHFLFTCTLLFFVTIASAQDSATGAAGSKLPAHRPDFWVWSAASAPVVKSFTELRVIAEAKDLTKGAGQSCEIEIRTGDNQRRVAVLPDAWVFKGEQPAPSYRAFEPTKDQVSAVGPLADGEYLLAWLFEGKRTSNVVHFRIAQDHNPAREPTLELVEIASRPREGLPHLVLRAARPAENDPAPLASDIAHARLNVAGVDRQLSIAAWAGPDGPLKVGGHYAYLLDMTRYVPAIDPGKQHMVFAKVGERQSPPIMLQYSAGEEKDWDAATETLVPVPEYALPSRELSPARTASPPKATR
jgi:hypothetical protein